ncbi:hypothetical protein FE819_00910 [Shigella sonnei]|nr:hypothetical protein [Shigella sonnei]
MRIVDIHDYRNDHLAIGVDGKMVSLTRVRKGLLEKDVIRESEDPTFIILSNTNQLQGIFSGRTDGKFFYMSAIVMVEKKKINFAQLKRLLNVEVFDITYPANDLKRRDQLMMFLGMQPTSIDYDLTFTEEPEVCTDLPDVVDIESLTLEETFTIPKVANVSLDTYCLGLLAIGAAEGLCCRKDGKVEGILVYSKINEKTFATEGFFYNDCTYGNALLTTYCRIAYLKGATVRLTFPYSAPPAMSGVEAEALTGHFIF